MTRLAVAFDRLAVLLLGVVLAAGGGFLIWARVRALAADGLPVQSLTRAVGQAWWPWAAAGAGAVLVLLGLRWLATHHRAPRAPRIRLTDGPSGGALTADPSAVADAAAEALLAQPTIVKASARAAVERGVPTITVTATTSARQDLSAIATVADEVASAAAAMTGDTVAVRTRLHVDAKRRRVVD